MGEIDLALGLPPSEGVAEAFLSGIISDIEEGEFGMILEGWDFEGGTEWAKDRLLALASNWKGGAA